MIGEDGPEIAASRFHRADNISSESRRRTEDLRKLAADIIRVGPPKHPIARVLSINGNALLTYRNGDRVSEEVLHGADPTRFRVDGVDFELLHLVLTTGSAGVAEDVRNRTRPSLHSIGWPR